MPKKIDTTSPTRSYRLSVRGGLIKHLGLQMYTGAVPALAELVSNAWDAMARNVWITIPLDAPISEADEIIVDDDGHGMAHLECNSAYLQIGRDRRTEEGDYSRAYKGMRKRKLQSRKGIGKLAGFGIANRIEVRTVASKREACHFAMDYEDIVHNRRFVEEGGYDAEVLADDGKTVKEQPGTRVTLSGLKIERAIPHDAFMRSMARRFAIMGDEFRIHVNGELVTKDEMPFQFRYPPQAGKWATETLADGRRISWWAGFTRKPIAEEEARGFVVFTRGKLAQAPWFFDLSGGTWGQHGLQYLTGEVKADFLDETGGIDLVATDRGTVRWEDPAAQPLKAWGQKLVKRLLEEWADRRREKSVADPRVIRYLQLAKSLPDRERKVFKSFVDRLTGIPQIDEDKEGKEILVELVAFGFNALTNRSFFELIRQLNATNPNDREKLEEALGEWDIIEAVTVAQVVRGRVEIIRKFARMIDEKVKEKPDLQEYLKKHPWLIDPAWALLSHETTLDNVLRRHFHLPLVGSDDGRQRVDFFCLGDRYKMAHVVELKRPGIVVGHEELDKLRDYVMHLREVSEDSSTDEKYRRDVSGLLVCSGVVKSSRGLVKSYKAGGVLEVREWANLLQTSEQLHQDYLDVVKERAPQDDPRLTEAEVDAIPAPVARPRRRKHKQARRRRRG